MNCTFYLFILCCCISETKHLVETNINISGLLLLLFIITKDDECFLAFRSSPPFSLFFLFSFFFATINTSYLVKLGNCYYAC
jgi:hypothetical protein